MDNKRALKTTARIGISVAFLIAIFALTPSFDRSELLPDWNESTPLWLSAALLFMLGSFGVATLRWHRVLFAFDLWARNRRLFSHYMAGQFVSNFFPTTVGGDVVRVNRLRRDSGKAPEAVASVVFERLTGWVILPLLTLTGLLVNPGLRDLGAASQIAFFLAVGSLLGLIAVVVVVGNDRLGQFLEHRRGLLRYFNALHLGVDKFREHPWEISRVLLTALGYQLVVLAAAACAAEALGIDQIGFTAVLAFVPATLIAQFLSPGIGGLGVREGALVLFLSPLGVPEERAIALGLLLYLLTLVASLIGLPALVFGGSAGSSPADDLVEEPLSP